LAALSQTPSFYVKRQLVGAVDPITKAIRLDAEGKQKQVFQVLPDYDRVVRLLLKDAHSQHKGFKLKRLAREMTDHVETGTARQERVAETVAEVV
jgi:hypothetical protein